MRSIKSLTLTSILIASSVATYANTTLLDEDWEGYSSLPATVTTPWQARFGGGTTPTPSTIRVVNTTIASVNSNWGFIDNSATDEPASNPGLLGTFTADSRLDISFSFMLPANYGNNSQLKFNLGYITPGGTTSTVL